MLEVWNEEWQRMWSGPAWGVLLPLAALGIFLYGFALSLWWELKQHPLHTKHFSPDIQAVKESDEGWLGEGLAWIQAAGSRPTRLRERFHLLHQQVFQRVDRRLNYIRVLTSAAPLLGLLGTIVGMNATFQVLAQGGSGIMDRMAGGIGTALISTQLGLLLAIPGALVAALIRRQRNQMEANLALLESRVLHDAVRKRKEGSR